MECEEGPERLFARLRESLGRLPSSPVAILRGGERTGTRSCQANSSCLVEPSLDEFE